MSRSAIIMLAAYLVLMCWLFMRSMERPAPRWPWEKPWPYGRSDS